MHFFVEIANNNAERRKCMKELMALLGFGAGMVAGVMLYKYSQDFQKGVDKGEKEIMKGAKQLEQKAEEKMDQAQKQINQKMDKTKKKIKAGMKKVSKKAEEIKDSVK